MKFEMLRSIKKKSIMNFSFSNLSKPRMLFFLLINVKMTIVGILIDVILIFMSRKNSCSPESSMEERFILSGPGSRYRELTTITCERVSKSF